MTRSEAKANKLAARMDYRKFYEGLECANCGRTTRYTTSGGCVACAKVKKRG